LEALRYDSDDDDTAPLPSWEEGDGSSPAVSEEEEEEEEDTPHGAFEPPDGLTILPRPTHLLAGADIVGVFVAMLWSNGWHVGVVKKHMTRGRHNYNILWDDGLHGSFLSLETYYVAPAVGAEVAQGAWMFLRESADE
jgi:hypothetical protein